MGEDILGEDCSPQHANHEVNGDFPERATVPRKRDVFSKGGKWRSGVASELCSNMAPKKKLAPRCRDSKDPFFVLKMTSLTPGRVVS